MDRRLILKAIADETRMNIPVLLLRRNYCVRALARKLAVSEAAVSQHLKILRKAGLLTDEKKGYFMHYDVNRPVLRQLSQDIAALAEIPREICTPEQGSCGNRAKAICHPHERRAGNAGSSCRGHSRRSRAHGGHCTYPES